MTKPLAHSGLLATALLLGAGSAWADPRVVVGHFAPFADSLAGTSVTVRVNGQPALENVVFGQFTDYISLPSAGSYTLEIVPTGTSTVAISATVALEANTDYTVLAIGDGGNQPLALLPLVDDNSAPAAGNIKLRVVHAAPFASDLAATAVSIRSAAGDIVGGLGNVPFGVASGYLELPAGTYDLKVAAPDGSTDFIDVRPVTLPAGAIVTLVANGGASGFPLGVQGLIPSAAPSNPLPLRTIGPVQARVAHFAPFAAELDATSVTVRVNGVDALEGVRFGDFTPEYLPLGQQGIYTVEILPTGTSTVAMSATLDLDAGDYTVAAIGNGSTQPLELLALTDDNTAPAAGNLKLRIVHAAPFSAELKETEVSIRTAAGDIVGGLSRVPYRAFSGVLEIPAGRYDLKVASPDGLIPFIDAAPLELPAGVSLSVFAVGDAINQPLGLIALPVGALELKPPFVDRATGHWFNPATSGQGLSLYGIPSQSRLVGTWYTFAVSGGQPRWFFLDSCAKAPGSEICAEPAAYDGSSVVLAVYESIGGVLNGPQAPVVNIVGTLSLEFSDCANATASFTLNDASGEFPLVNVIPRAVCQ